MRTHFGRALVARMMLGVLLFAQAALAGACDLPSAAPAMAFAAGADHPICHEAPARNANLCLAHCLSADQSSDTPQLPAMMSSSAPVLIVALADAAKAHEVAVRYALPRPPAPPPRILFQSFQI